MILIMFSYALQTNIPLIPMSVFLVRHLGTRLIIQRTERLLPIHSALSRPAVASNPVLLLEELLLRQPAGVLLAARLGVDAVARPLAREAALLQVLAVRAAQVPRGPDVDV